MIAAVAIVGTIVLLLVVEYAHDRALRREQMLDRERRLRILRELRDRDSTSIPRQYGKSSNRSNTRGTP